MLGDDARRNASWREGRRKISIGLIDIDGKLPNLTLMKISAYYKSLGEEVDFLQESKKYEKIFATTIFDSSKEICESLLNRYSNIEIGGTGYSLKKILPPAIENTSPDYDLYTAEMIAPKIKGIIRKEARLKKAKQIVSAGMGFSSRGCVRNCAFCVVPQKEGKFHNVAEIKALINPKSNILILHDNNITADPICVEKLNEIRDRGLIVDINQGLDIRLMTEEIALAMSEVKHLRTIHYAWDLMEFENHVLHGISILSKYIKRYRHTCFVLVGFNTTFEQDMYRFIKLREIGVTPYIMIYNKKNDLKLKHFARWVNAHIHKVCKWEDYQPWKHYERNLS